MQPIRVKIQNHEFLVEGDEDPEQVIKVAEYVDAKLHEIDMSGGELSGIKAAILAALQIAGEYFQLLKDRDEMLVKIRQRTQAIIYHIDSVSE